MLNLTFSFDLSTHSRRKLKKGFGGQNLINEFNFILILDAALVEI